MNPKEQCDAYFNFYLSVGLTPYESKRCSIHLVNELIEFCKLNKEQNLEKILHLTETKYYLTQI